MPSITDPAMPYILSGFAKEVFIPGGLRGHPRLHSTSEKDFFHNGDFISLQKNSPKTRQTSPHKCLQTSVTPVPICALARGCCRIASPNTSPIKKWLSSSGDCSSTADEFWIDKQYLTMESNVLSFQRFHLVRLRLWRDHLQRMARSKLQQDFSKFYQFPKTLLRATVFSPALHIRVTTESKIWIWKPK